MVALPEAEARPDARRFAVPRVTVTRAGCLVLGGYLVAAVLVNWRLWAGLRTMIPMGDPGPADNYQFAWFMRYTADALAHGHLPALVTPALNAPRGINLMWNTSFLLPALALAPVTLLGGPQASLTLMLTLGYFGSAAAMYWLLRRYRASVLAGALGGAVYGFSPALVDSGVSHYNLQFEVLPPLIVGAALMLLGDRARPAVVGAWLGVLVAAQVFIEEETLADLVIAGLPLLVVLAASRPQAVMSRLRTASAGLGIGVLVTLAVCGYGLWVQFHGPLSEHGSPYPNSKNINSAGAFVNPQSGMLVHTASSAAYAVGHGLPGSEYLAYLGWPLLVLLVLIIVRYWGDLRIRAAGVVWAVLELLSLGGGSPLLPFHWLQGLPLLVELMPDRLSILADGAAAAVLAFGLDLARAGAAGARAADGRTSHARAPSATAARIRAAAPIAVAALAVLPLIPRPAAAVTPDALPAGWYTVFSRLALPATASVLVVPAPYSQQAAAMHWQADTGKPGELVAGWFIGPGDGGKAATSTYGSKVASKAVVCLDALWKGSISAERCSMVPAALAYWHPAAVVADTSPGSPLGKYLTKLLGPPATRDGQLLGWRSGS